MSFVPMEAVGEGGGLDLSREALAGDVRQGYSSFVDGDVLVAKITPCFENGKGALANGLLGGRGFGTTELHVLRPVSCNPRWLFYLTQSSVFREQGAGSMYGAGGQKRVPPEFIKDYRALAPPLPTQRAIAAFLDRKTAAIDALIEKKQRLLDLLAEKRTALIHQAVTKGLDQTVPMKVSGIPPLGTIPAHWEVVRNKVVAREVTDLSRSGDETLLTVSHLTGVTRRSDKEVTMFLAESNVGYKRVAPGDLVINTMWAWMGALGMASEHGIVSPAYGVYRLNAERVLPAYYEFFYRSAPYVCEMTRFSKGVWSSRLRLYPESFLALRVPVPPLGEQEQIVRAIESSTGWVPAVQQRLADSITRLREYRQSVITAAVTGQLPIPEEAA